MDKPYAAGLDAFDLADIFTVGADHLGMRLDIGDIGHGRFLIAEDNDLGHFWMHRSYEIQLLMIARSGRPARYAALARASASALRSAGFSSTDSPQPQAELWFGLWKVKPVRSVVTSKSIRVPSR